MVNTTLDADVGPCAKGIIIATPNVVFDLNGHKIFGLPSAGDGPGIFVVGMSNVIIRNGTVTGFDNGIYMEEGGHNTVTGMDVHDNIGPLNNSGFFSEGIQTFLSDDNLITGNRVVHNGPGAGIFIYDGQRNVVSNNQVANNNVASEDSGHHGTVNQDIGIAVIFTERPTTGNVVSGNQVSGNGLDGIQLGRGTSNTRVSNNQVTANGFGQINNNRVGDGIAIFGTNNVVDGNVAIQNAHDGIRAAVGGNGNQVRGNRAFQNTVFDLADDNANCDANTWAANGFATANQACIH